MALYLLQPGLQPLGQFDFLDTDLSSVKGGEFGVFGEASRVNTASEKAAYDVFDGYVADLVDAGDPTASRPVLKLADGTDGAVARYLLDEGTLGYGTLFGQVIGLPVGLSTTGSNLGPHTAAASGKVTAWDKSGLYGVSLDACAADLVPLTGNAYDTPLPGQVLYAGDATGLLTRTGTYKVASFIELSGNGSLVTTPGKLVGAAESFDRVVIHYFGAAASGPVQ